MRRPHYLPGNKANQIPSNCIWFDTETKPEILPNGDEEHHLWFGWAAYRRRRNGLHWCATDWLRFTSRSLFWDWVCSHARERTRLYLFAHNGQFDLPVLDAFSELPKRGYRLCQAVVECPPMVLLWRNGRRSIRFVDTLNIFRQPLENIGKHVGLPKLKMPPPDAAGDEWDAYGKRDVEVIMAAMLKWWGFLRDNDLGGFQPTLAAQAFATFRHRFMDAQIFIDDKVEALKYSRDAYLGGRVECFRLGHYKGRFHHLDINSMYPAVMASESYPVSLVGLYSRATHEQLRKWLKQYRIVADVSVETRTPLYPKVMEGKLCFPIGRLRVTLTSPELQLALDRGHLRKVHRLAVYKQDRPFKAFVDFFYAQRLAAKARGDEMATWFLKILANSLYGKFGQRGRRYEELGACTDMSVKVWQEINAQTHKIKHYRQFGGLVQHWVEDGESTHSHPAIAAHVTAYARCLLWSIIARCGRGHVYYCDTDCVVVDNIGRDRLAPLLDADKLGALKVESVYNNITLFGPKDYIFGDKKVTKGVRRNATWIDDSTVEQVQFVGFKGMLRNNDLTAPIVRQQIKHLTREYTKGRPQSDGRVLPLICADW